MMTSNGKPPEAPRPLRDQERENRALAYLEVHGVDSFLSRFDIKMMEDNPIRDIKATYTIDAVSAHIYPEDRQKFHKVMEVASTILDEIESHKSDPAAVFSEDDPEVKYTDVQGLDALSKAQFARIVKLRLKKLG